jgi:16S rRNA processing protein RimM
VTRPEWVAIGVLGKTRGNRGELLAVALAGRPERFEGLQRVWLFGGNPAVAGGTPYEVESVWLHDGRPVLKFRGVDTISDAEMLTGAEIRLPFADRLPLEEGEVYQADLIGCEVLERANGERLGAVTRLQESGGPGLLEVKTPDGGELLIPFARSICVEIDVAARRILVELPEGLKELNRK